MGHVRTALYLDFDNVFLGLHNLDPYAAFTFAGDPAAWLRHLSTTLITDGPRRWLILRCYLNPAGWVFHGEAGERCYFSRFRQNFVRAGFEVIDCPRYNATKNGADIRLVIDAVDALSADPTYQEFVIASGDSDMTPLLQRIRRADRRTTIVSPTVAAEAYTSIADRALDSRHLLALVYGEQPDLDDDASDDMAAGFVDTQVTPVSVASFDGAYEAFRSRITAEYESAPAALNMAVLAQQLHDDLGDVIKESNWFGYGGFRRALESLNLPNLRVSQHHLWDESRHEPPVEAEQLPFPGTSLPDAVKRMAAVVGLPRLPRESWPPIYEALSEYTRTHPFNLTQCTSWCRDRLREQGLAVSRNSISYVARGATYGGCPLYRQPPPTAEEIREAFIGYVLEYAESADAPLTDEEVAEVRDWLGADEEASGPSAVGGHPDGGAVA